MSHLDGVKGNQAEPPDLPGNVEGGYNQTRERTESWREEERKATQPI